MSPKHARSPHRLLNLIGIAIVALGGLGVGYWIAGSTKSVSATSESVEPQQLSVDDVELPPLLRDGLTAPDIQVVGPQGDTVLLADLCAGNIAVVSFLSNGCDPCYSWTDWVETSALFRQGVVRPVLLADAPESFSERTTYPIYRLAPNQSFDLGINVHPFVMGVDRSNRISFAVNGYRQRLDEDFILDSFEQ